MCPVCQSSFIEFIEARVASIRSAQLRSASALLSLLERNLREELATLNRSVRSQSRAQETGSPCKLRISIMSSISYMCIITIGVSHFSPSPL